MCAQHSQRRMTASPSSRCAARTLYFSRANGLKAARMAASMPALVGAFFMDAWRRRLVGGQTSSAPPKGRQQRDGQGAACQAAACSQCTLGGVSTQGAWQAPRRGMLQLDSQAPAPTIC